MRRFYLKEKIELEKKFFIKNDLFNHVINVLKFKKNQNIVFFDITSNNFFCEILNVNKTNAEVIPLYKIPQKVQSKIEIKVYQCIPKGNILNDIIEKDVELGVTEFTPIISERTIKRTKEFKEKWNEIIKNSTQQCGRSRLMKINTPVYFKDLFKNEFDGEKIIFYENANELIKLDFFNKKKKNSVHIILGPEGGFSLDEVNTANSNGFKSYSLGNNVLKCLTANILAVGFIYLLNSK